MRTSCDEIVLLGEAEEARVGNGHSVGGLLRVAVAVAVVTAEVGQGLQILKFEFKGLCEVLGLTACQGLQGKDCGILAWHQAALGSNLESYR